MLASAEASPEAGRSSSRRRFLRRRRSWCSCRLPAWACPPASSRTASSRRPWPWRDRSCAARHGRRDWPWAPPFAHRETCPAPRPQSMHIHVTPHRASDVSRARAAPASAPAPPRPRAQSSSSSSSSSGSANAMIASPALRSEEHTSELQSRLHLVCRLLLEKKKKKEKNNFRNKKYKKITEFLK